MDKRKSIIILLILILIILLGVILFNVCFNDKSSNNHGDNNNEIVSYDADSFQYLEFCSTENCPLGKMEYQVLKTNSNNSKIKKAVKKVNSSVLAFYDMSNQSTACPDTSLGILHSNAGVTSVSLYQDENILNITFFGNDINLCNQTQSNFQFYSFYYDLASSKEIAQGDILSKYQISEDEIMTAIGNEIQNRNMAEGTNYSYNGSGYQVYIDNDGQIKCYFLTDSNSMSTSLNKKVN